MFPSNTTENIRFITFCMGNKDSSHFGIFSCVNRFKYHGNKPLELLMDHFGNARYPKS